MPSVADCLRQHGGNYLTSQSCGFSGQQRKVLHAIMRCRTGELGGTLWKCDSCRRKHWVGRSCGNRHCPSCQHEKTAAWLGKQSSRLLPVHHFLVTFTVPTEVRSVLRAHQKAGYDALFAAGRDTIRHRASKSRYLKGSEPGFFGVLHTWGRDPLVYHPHVHFVMPGGAPSADGSKWQSTPENFLFPHKSVIRDYKQFFAAELRSVGLYDQVPASAWRKKWVVDIKPVGDGQAVLKYLAPYVHRVAISDKRILACDDDTVTYRYTPSGKKKSKTRTVTGDEFVQGFVQHVLPHQFQKVRHYGWMNAKSLTRLESVKWLVWLHLGWVYWLASGTAPQRERVDRPRLRCSHCGGTVRLVRIIHADCSLLVDMKQPYFDSG